MPNYTHSLSWNSQIKLGGNAPINFASDEAAEKFAKGINGDVGLNSHSAQRYLCDWAFCNTSKKIVYTEKNAIPAANQKDRCPERMTFYNSLAPQDLSKRKTIYIPAFAPFADEETRMQKLVTLGKDIAAEELLLADDGVTVLDRYLLPGQRPPKDVFIADTTAGEKTPA